MNSTKVNLQLGELILTCSLASEEQLELCLLGAAQTGLPLGMQLILQNLLDFDNLHSLVAAQSLVRDEQISRDTATKAVLLAKRKAVPLNLALDLLGICVESPVKNRLGSLLVDGELLDRNVLKRGLKIAKATCLPLGKVLVAGSSMDKVVIDKAVQMQNQLRTGLIAREEAIDAIVSVKPNSVAFAKEEEIKLQKTRVGQICVDVGLLSRDDIEMVAQEAIRRHALIGETLVAMQFISNDSLHLILEVQRLVRQTRFSLAHAIKMLRRIHATDLFPCAEAENEAETVERTPISFLNFLRLARLVDANGKNLLSQSGVYSSHGVKMLEETWTAFPSSNDDDLSLAIVIPSDVAACLAENGFTTPEQQLSVARAAREYKQLRELQSTFEQALVKYHASILDGSTMVPWTGTFPALSAWAPKENT
ncbi:MAG: hypothetical protein C0507_00495 [Cyanobacteria bacterium PR.3.49]|nr:hypothetical protein [Cyanobacteria bacterium PR.3.49]